MVNSFIGCAKKAIKKVKEIKLFVANAQKRVIMYIYQGG